MRERPILFSGSMVRAILEGRKTVTRRAMNPQPLLDGHFWTYGGAGWSDRINSITPVAGHSLARGCPYGQPGDRLWVREAWTADAQVDSIAPRELSQGEPIRYPADGGVRQTGCAMVSQGKGRPSIHMPRWASRILLEITEVRVERLQDISEEQAIAEGIHFDKRRWFPTDEGGPAFVWPQDAFQHLFQSVTGGDEPDANPWVWVLEFKQLGQAPAGSAA
ncbi:hypothetical protein [Pseudomonas sp.]|uniref:hypothetical protein n=1 Tax=Pseudomonas sp. TaxID=306 RepID=UPI0029079176|nr:hypothetical protein [Pseudomonas sp.]MDU4250513.1 hypothetical protein [Pseudomonas sp.]